MRRALTDQEQDKVAEAIVEQVELSNWIVEQGPTREGHGPKIMSATDAKSQ